LVSKLPENLRKYRKLAGLKQEELAQKLGKTRSVISNWEKGINRPDADTIAKICAILKVTPNELLGWDEEENEAKEEEKDDITIAAHIEGENLTEEEQKEIEDFIQFVLSKRKKK
jgi:transcriptional regulator with XRE-family HTH domain